MRPGRLWLPLLALAAGHASSAAGQVKISGWPESVHAEVAYVGDLFVPASGARSTEAEYLDNLDLMLSIDLEALFRARRTTLRAHVQSNRGGSISMSVGDFQGLSNIEAPSEWRLYELWLEHNVWPGRLSLLAGVYDVNAEFDVIPVAGDFLNSSFGFGPEYSGSGVNGPSTFPLTTLGARLKTRPLRNVYAALSVLDGAPGDPESPERSRFALGDGEGALISWEIGYARPAPGVAVVLDEPPARVQEGGRRIGRGRLVQRLRTKVAFGGWGYTREFESLDPAEQSRKSWGVYALGERLIFGAAEGSSLSVFARLGLANDAVNQLGSYAGGGLVYTGMVPSRADDVVGLAIAHARNGSPFLEARPAEEGRSRAETVVELFYRVHLTQMFQLQPDVQRIIDPGMNPGLQNAVVFGLRGIATLSLH